MELFQTQFDLNLPLRARTIPQHQSLEVLPVSHRHQNTQTAWWHN